MFEQQKFFINFSPAWLRLCSVWMKKEATAFIKLFYFTFVVGVDSQLVSTGRIYLNALRCSTIITSNVAWLSWCLCPRIITMETLIRLLGSKCKLRLRVSIRLRILSEVAALGCLITPSATWGWPRPPSATAFWLWPYPTWLLVLVPSSSVGHYDGHVSLLTTALPPSVHFCMQPALPWWIFF